MAKKQLARPQKPKGQKEGGDPYSRVIAWATIIGLAIAVWVAYSQRTQWLDEHRARLAIIDVGLTRSPQAGMDVPEVKFRVKNFGGSTASEIDSQVVHLYAASLPDGPMPDNLIASLGVRPASPFLPKSTGGSLEPGDESNLNVTFHGVPMADSDIAALMNGRIKLFILGRIRYLTINERHVVEFCVMNFPPATTRLVNCEKWNAHR
jgi:hypothetical protein